MSLRSLRVWSLTLAVYSLASGSVLAKGGSPVRIASCTVLRAAPPVQPFYPRYWYPYYGAIPPQSAAVTDGIAITYTNAGTQVADRVAFDVNYRGQRDKIVDVGKFSPNVQIAHTFGNYEGLAFLGQTPDSCRVEAVRFVDGHVWQTSHIRQQAR